MGSHRANCSPRLSESLSHTERDSVCYVNLAGSCFLTRKFRHVFACSGLAFSNFAQSTERPAARWDARGVFDSEHNVDPWSSFAAQVERQFAFRHPYEIGRLTLVETTALNPRGEQLAAGHGRDNTFRFAQCQRHFSAELLSQLLGRSVADF